MKGLWTEKTQSNALEDAKWAYIGKVPCNKRGGNIQNAADQPGAENCRYGADVLARRSISNDMSDLHSGCAEFASLVEVVHCSTPTRFVRRKLLSGKPIGAGV